MIGLQLKLTRIAKRIKQIDLAQRTGINRSRLSLIENDWTAPSQQELDQICNQLGIDLCKIQADVLQTDEDNLAAFREEQAHGSISAGNGR